MEISSNIGPGRNSQIVESEIFVEWIGMRGKNSAGFKPIVAGTLKSITLNHKPHTIVNIIVQITNKTV